MVPHRQLLLDFSARDESCFEDFHVIPANQELFSLLSHGDLPVGGSLIWGGDGCGKSHLLQAACQDQVSAAYVPLKRFAHHGPDLLEGLHALPLVCIDDLELVLGDKAWEEGLFQLFNLIRDAGHRLLISANAPPRQLPCVVPDLASRLAWGMVYQLHGLDDGAKAMALRKRALGRGIVLDQETLDYILQRSERGTKALFQVLDTLDQLSLANKRKITIPFVRQIMGW